VGVREGGFTIASLANNHILDMGARGLADTIAACEAADLLTVGAGATLVDASNARVVDVNGVSVAILAFAEHEFSIATPSSAGACPLDVTRNFEYIAAAKERADFVLVILHGGNEYLSLPNPRLARTCRFFAHVGANAVVCHHTHVPSAMEVVNDVPIIYGTGNLLFDAGDEKPEGWHLGYLVSLAISEHAVCDVELIPYVQCKGFVGTRRLHGSEAERFLDHVLQLSNAVTNEQALALAWDEFCRSHRAEYLSRVAAFGRIDQYLWRRGLLPSWLLRRRSANWLGLTRCESHHDALVAALESMMTGDPT
jgi:poly-gamma-glutamate synthesis protein (capsule biosynthesis protein)